MWCISTSRNLSPPSVAEVYTPLIALLHLATSEIGYQIPDSKVGACDLFQSRRV